MELNIPEIESKGILALGIFLASVPLALNFLVVDTEIRNYSARVNVTEMEKNDSSLDLGINAGSDLRYGEVPLTSNVSKYFRVESSGISLVKIHSTGNISRYLKFERKQVVNGTEKVFLEVVPERTGYFEGDVKVKIQSSNNVPGETWIKLKSYFY